MMTPMAAQHKARPDGSAAKDQEFENLLRRAAAFLQNRKKLHPVKVAKAFWHYAGFERCKRGLSRESQAL
jgi:hypothetical protein